MLSTTAPLCMQLYNTSTLCTMLYALHNTAAWQLSMNMNIDEFVCMHVCSCVRREVWVQCKVRLGCRRHRHYQRSATIAVAESTGYLLFPGLDVCPPVQENLDSLEMAFVSSPVESGAPILAETQRQNYFIQIHGIFLHAYIHTYIYSNA